LENDLINFWTTDGLEIIGGINEFGSIGVSGGPRFNLLFYKNPSYYKRPAFPFMIELIYEDISKSDLSQLLNKKMREENAIFRCVLTAYETKEDV
jgi:hypothetical protein